MLSLIGTTARADAHAWWTVSASADSVVAYVRANSPSGSKLLSSGTGSEASGRTETVLTFTWPAVDGVLGFRGLSVTMTSLGGGVTGVLAQANSQWIVPRPATERVPAAVRVVNITSARPGGPVVKSVTVTNRTKAREIVSLVDEMPIAQPVAMSCPAMILTGARVIALEFRAAPRGPVLAEASYTDYFPRTGRSDACSPVDFSIGGRRQDALIGGDFLARVEQIVGTRLG